MPGATDADVERAIFGQFWAWLERLRADMAAAGRTFAATVDTGRPQNAATPRVA